MRSTLFNVFFYAYSFYVALRLWLLARRGKRPAMHRLIRLWGETMLRAVEVILRSKVEIRGWEAVPKDRPVLFVSKHQSELDIVLLAALMPHTGAIAMEELKRYPFFGAFLEALDVVMVAVDSGPQNRTEQAVEGTARTFEQGRPMMIYPEGELMKLGAKERYRRGAAHIYTRLAPHTVPVATSVGVVWPQRCWRKNAWATGAIAFLEPIPQGLGFDAFMSEMEERIEEGTMRLIREHAPEPVLAVAEERQARGANNKDGA